MKTRLLNNKSRWFTSILVVTILTVGAFVLSNASGKQRRISSPPPVQNSIEPLSPIYVGGNLTFGNPVQMVRPLSPIFFQQGGEPEVKTDIFGNIYVTAIQGVPGGVDLWKSIDQGATFVYLGQPDGAQDKCPTIPQCAALGGGDDQIDVSTGGYLYVSSLWLGNVTMSTSYDGGTGGVSPGQKWEVHPAAAGVPSDDRQWVAAYGPQTLYMTYAATAATRPPGGLGLFVTKSTDAGKTFGVPVEITAVTALDSVNVEGNIVVDPYTGNLYTTYIPLNMNNVIRLASSTDGGATWNVTTAYTGPNGTTTRGVFPIMSVDRGGNLHLVFTQSSDDANHNNCHVLLTSTTNPSAATPTWRPAVQVDAGVGTACQAWIVGGSPGIVDVTWLGQSGPNPNTPPPPNPNPQPFDWHVYVTQVTNVFSASPTFARNQAESAQVHDASICFNGGACATGTRTMLEYYTMTLDQNGNANIVFPDSVNNCPSATCTTNAWFVKQTGGNKAYSPPAGPAPATFATNLTIPMSGGTAEPNAWVDSYNCIYEGSIGGPIDSISTDAGLSFTTHSVVVGTGVHGGDFDIKTLPKADGTRPDQIYTADLGVASVHIGKSTDRGNTYFQPGTMGAAGEVSVSSDRMWLRGDRGVPTAPDQTLYLMDHEFVSEAIRFSALTNDTAWSAFTSGMTDPELVLPPTSSLPNTNPGPCFVDPVSHNVYGVFGASTLTTNTLEPPFGKEPNVWIAVGGPPAAAGAPPSAFTNHPVFKGPIDSPSNPAPPAGTTTYGAHMAAIFPWGDVDSAGNVYAVWALNSARPNAVQPGGAPSHTYDIWFAASHDGGVNFYGPWRVSSGVGTSVFPSIAAGDNGRVDIAWYQSSGVAPPILSDPSTPGQLTGGPNQMPAGSTWNVMFAQSLNANTREPVFTASQASDHVIHSGSISIGGLTGSSDRSLLDFFQVAVGPDGLGNIMCADNGLAGTHINYARQNGGQLVKTSPSSITCLPPPPLPTDVVSHKIHGASFNGDIHLLPPNPGIEMRRNTSADITPAPNAGRDHELIITFPVAVNAGTVTVATNNPADTPTPTGNIVSGNGTAVLTVDLHNIQNPRRVTVTLNNVANIAGTAGPGPVNVLMGVLLGDTTEDAVVNTADITQTRRQSGNVAGSSNFRQDVTLDGVINTADITAVRRQSGNALPP